MRVSKWVDFGTEVEVVIDANDIRSALAEAWEQVTQDRLGEEGPTRAVVLRALNETATFLKAITDEQIEDLTGSQRQIIWAFLLGQAKRYEPTQAIEDMRRDCQENDGGKGLKGFTLSCVEGAGEP